MRWITHSTVFVREVCALARIHGFRVRVERHAPQFYRVLWSDAAGGIILDEAHLADGRLALLKSCERLAEVCGLPVAYHPIGGATHV